METDLSMCTYMCLRHIPVLFGCWFLPTQGSCIVLGGSQVQSPCSYSDGPTSCWGRELLPVHVPQFPFDGSQDTWMGEEVRQISTCSQDTARPYAGTQGKGNIPQFPSLDIGFSGLESRVVPCWAGSSFVAQMKYLGNSCHGEQDSFKIIITKRTEFHGFYNIRFWFTDLVFQPMNDFAVPHTWAFN